MVREEVLEPRGYGAGRGHGAGGYGTGTGGTTKTEIASGFVPGLKVTRLFQECPCNQGTHPSSSLSSFVPSSVPMMATGASLSLVS
ncbi:hypothetical protein CY35_16G046500 [Sphagnum magellanicum]|nr:hypothetical protein CY35_16G046500 [Sphagnum magellanicum]